MVDQWSGPAGAPSPQQFRREPTDGIDQLLQVIRNQGTRIKEATSNLLGSAGIRLKPGRMIVEQSLDVLGDLTATGSTIIGGTLDVTGNAVFSGDLAVPNGSITNDALASPVVPSAFYNATSAFSLPDSYVSVVSQTLTTPVGFTKAIVFAQAYTRATNGTSGVNTFLKGRPVINGVAGPEDYTKEISTEEAGIVNSSLSQLVSGLTGGQTFIVSAQAYMSTATAARSGNTSSINGVVMWFR